MWRYFLFTVVVYSCLGKMSGQTPANDPHWQLLWGDNFNGIGLSSADWLVRDHFDHWGEPTVNLNRPENIKVENGEAIITLRAEGEPYSCPSQFLVYDWDCKRQRDTGKKYAFTTGGFETHSKNFKYGYLEARIKVPFSFGNWPSFWTWQNGFIGSNEAEIDVFEMDKSIGNGVMPTNVHLDYCTNYPNSCNNETTLCPNGEYTCEDCIPCAQRFGLNVNIPNYANVYRTYAVEWSPERITWYVDGNIYRVLPNPGVHDPVHIIFGNGVHHGQDIEAYLNHMGEYPSIMRIDYFRYYALKFDCNQVINQCSYNLAAHDNKVKKSITIGGSGCSNSVPNGSSVFLRAAEGVLINGTFSTPLGSQLFIDGSSCYNLPDISSEIRELEGVSGDGSTLTIAGEVFDVGPEYYDIAKEWTSGVNIVFASASEISEVYNIAITYPDDSENNSVLVKLR